MFGSIFTRTGAPSTPSKNSNMHLNRTSSEAGEFTIAGSLVFADVPKTPKTRRKSDIHDLLPEMLSHHNSEENAFQFLRLGETISTFYTMDTAFYSVGAKSVTRCVEVGSGKPYVMKQRLKDAYGGDNERHWRRVMERLLRMEPNRHVVAIHRVLEDDTAFYIVMDECNGGQLFDLLLKESAITQRECKRIIREILTAVGHLHDNGLIHRDIKPENIMLSNVDGESRIQLIDFDTCEEMASRRLSAAVTPSKGSLCRRSSRVIGTLGYIAPESFNGEYSTASDLFSIGIIFFILMTGDMPFDDGIYLTAKVEGAEDELQTVGSPQTKRVFSQLVESQIDWTMSPWPQLPLARDLCQRLLETNPDNRLSSCDEALAHAWLAGAPTTQPV